MPVATQIKNGFSTTTTSSSVSYPALTTDDRIKSVQCAATGGQFNRFAGECRK
jgi:hypothetical protein